MTQGRVTLKVRSTGVGSGVCMEYDTPNYLCGGWDIDMYIPLEQRNT